MYYESLFLYLLIHPPSHYLFTYPVRILTHDGRRLDDDTYNMTPLCDIIINFLCMWFVVFVWFVSLFIFLFFMNTSIIMMYDVHCSSVQHTAYNIQQAMMTVTRKCFLIYIFIVILNRPNY